LGVGMRISIASRSRWNIVNKLLTQFHPDLFPHTVIFVPKSQHRDYCRTVWGVAEQGAIIIRTVPDEWVLAPIRVHMAERAREDGEDSHIMVDDDLRLERRKSPDTWHTKVSDRNDVANMFRSIQTLLDDGTWSHVAIAPRFMQQDRGLGGPNEVVAECQRAMCIVGWRLDDFFAIDYGRMMARSDFDATLQSLRLGRPNLVLGYWICGQMAMDMAGGCQDYRTPEMFDATAKQLAEYHPGLVTLVQKSNKSGSVNRERTEVMIQWRKALGHNLRQG
jgi:hypothetical protein